MITEFNMFKNKNKGQQLIDVVRDGNLFKVKQLLIDPNVDINFQNKYRNTALIMAAWLKHFDILKELIKSGAKWNIKDGIGNDFLHYLTPDYKKLLIQEFPEQYRKYLKER